MLRGLCAARCSVNAVSTVDSDRDETRLPVASSRERFSKRHTFLSTTSRYYTFRMNTMTMLHGLHDVSKLVRHYYILSAPHVNTNGILSWSHSTVALIDEVRPPLSGAATVQRHDVPNARTPSALQGQTESRCRRLGHLHLHHAPEGPERLL